MKLFLIYVLYWNSWICKMLDYLKGSIAKFESNFENAFENKCDSVLWWKKYQVKHWGV